MNRLIMTLRDETGIETLEWISIGVLILLVAFAIYPGALQEALNQVVSDVGNALTTNSATLAGS
jgi:hypothetical protein